MYERELKIAWVDMSQNDAIFPTLKRLKVWYVIISLVAPNLSRMHLFSTIFCMCTVVVTFFVALFFATGLLCVCELDKRLTETPTGTITPVTIMNRRSQPPDKI